MNITDKLDMLGEEVMRRYPWLNHGGCCVYAAMVVQALHKHNIKASGIVASWGAEYLNRTGITIDKVREGLKKNTHTEWNNNGVNFSHVGVEFEYRAKIRTHRYHYDSTGVKKAGKELDGMPIYAGRLTLEELRTLAGTKKGWNDTFDRKHIPELRKLVKSYLGVDKVQV
jgi:hypothetical protein